MIDDFDIPGLDDLVDLISSLWESIGLEDLIIDDLDEPVLSLMPDAGISPDYPPQVDFWVDLSGQPLDASGFMHEFGNMQFHNPFAGHTSPIESGSYDDLVAKTSLITGLPTDLFPN